MFFIPVRYQGGAHTDPQAVVGVEAQLALLVGALDHVIGLVVDEGLLVLPGHAGGGPGVLVVGDEVAPLVVGVLPVGSADGVGDGAALGALVQGVAVVLVLDAPVLFLADQVAQGVVVVGDFLGPIIVDVGDKVKGISQNF